MRMTHLLTALAAVPLLGLAAPVLADDPPAAAPAAAEAPTCSATVTDHCIQRAAHARTAAHHAGKHKGHKDHAAKKTPKA